LTITDSGFMNYHFMYSCRSGWYYVMLL